MCNVTDDNSNFNRRDFDEHRLPHFSDRGRCLEDVHSVASALKMYFRELPNPLCTYQLYHAFIDAFQCSPEVDCRLFHLQQVVMEMPPPETRYCARWYI
jgi:hypothetical protein